MSSDIEYEKLVEIRTITQWKDGAIYRTVHKEFKWVPLSTQMYSVTGNEQICAVSGAKLKEFNYNTIRRVK